MNKAKTLRILNKAVEKMGINQIVYLGFKKPNDAKAQFLASVYEVKDKPGEHLIEVAPESSQLLSDEQLEMVFAHELAHILSAKGNRSPHDKHFWKILDEAYPHKNWGKVEDDIYKAATKLYKMHKKKLRA